jgi:hypothetical protein
MALSVSVGQDAGIDSQTPGARTLRVDCCLHVKDQALWA